MSRILVVVVPLLLSCVGERHDPVAPAAAPPRLDASGDAAPPALEWGEPELVADGLASDDFAIPLCAAVSPTGAVFVAWSTGERGAFEVWVAEDAGPSGGRWQKSRVGRAAGTLSPRPSLAFDAEGTLVVAWSVPWDDVGAACVAIRSAADGRWTAATPLDEAGSGDVSLTSGQGGVRAACVRGVRKFSARKLLGDFVHDPPVQPYDKVAIALLERGSWREGALLDERSLLEAEHPRLCGDHLLFSRNGLLGDAQPPRDVVYVDLRRPDALETVASGEGLDTGSDTIAMTLDHGRPIAAFSKRDCIWVRERPGDSWSEPIHVIRDRIVEQPSLASTERGVVLAAIARFHDQLVFLTRHAGTWSSPKAAFPAQSAIVVSIGAAPLLVWCDGLPPIGTNRWNGHDPGRFPRRIFIARARPDDRR